MHPMIVKALARELDRERRTERRKSGGESFAAGRRRGAGCVDHSLSSGKAQKENED